MRAARKRDRRLARARGLACLKLWYEKNGPSSGAVCLRTKTTLCWHYRSQHSSLIEFSNAQFYDRQLRVFPSPEINRDRPGLSFRYVRDGVYYRGKGRYNEVEAREVAKAVI